MTAGGLYAWQRSRELTRWDFAALIFAAIRGADTANAARLEAAFPEMCQEARRRYNSPGGLIPGDPGYHPFVADAAAADLGDDPDGDNTEYPYA